MQAAGAGERFRIWPAVRYLMIMRTFWLLTLATGALGLPPVHTTRRLFYGFQSVRTLAPA